MDVKKGEIYSDSRSAKQVVKKITRKKLWNENFAQSNKSLKTIDFHNFSVNIYCRYFVWTFV
jgi:hypothetical protein